MNIERLHKLVQDKVTEWDVKQMSLPEGEERAIYRGAIKALMVWRRYLNKWKERADDEDRD